MNLVNKQLFSDPRIVGGQVVNPPFKHPFMVYIFMLPGDGTWHSCGGTLYNSNTVITAAHCAQWLPSAYSVQAHRHNIYLPPSVENSTIYNVKNIKVHPLYNNNTSIYDVALLTLDTSVTKSAPIIDLDSGSLGNNVGQLDTAVGWGALYDGGSSSPVLQEAQIPIYDTQQCVDDYKNYSKKIHPESMLCAARSSGDIDTCQGDSGGPLGVFNHNKFTLVGITSWGEGCAKLNWPGVYARVSKVANWIKANAI
jgi:trypsin